MFGTHELFSIAPRFNEEHSGWCIVEVIQNWPWFILGFEGFPAENTISLLVSNEAELLDAVEYLEFMRLHSLVMVIPPCQGGAGELQFIHISRIYRRRQETRESFKFLFMSKEGAVYCGHPVSRVEVKVEGLDLLVNLGAADSAPTGNSEV